MGWTLIIIAWIAGTDLWQAACDAIRNMHIEQTPLASEAAAAKVSC